MKKDITLNIRISEPDKKRLEELAQEYNLSISATLRLIIKEFEPYDELHEEEHLNKTVRKTKFEKDFAEIIVWLYKTKINPYSTQKSYSQIKDILGRAIRYEDMVIEMKQELLKVEQDLLRIANLTYSPKNYFLFPLENNSYSFNYKILEEYIESEFIVKVIKINS